MKKTTRNTLIYSMALILFSGFVLADTFLIPRVYAVEATASTKTTAVVQEETTQTEAVVTEIAAQTETTTTSENLTAKTSTKSGGRGPGASKGRSRTSSTTAETTETTTESSTSTSTTTATSYQDEHISVTLTEYRVSDTTVYVADVVLSDAEYLQTALAQSAYGRNVTAKTSTIAESVNAILAINGDYYGSQQSGYVLRNGVLYRSTARSGQEDLVIYADGSFEIIQEGEVSAESLLANGAVQILSFGPALIEDGEIAVTASEEVGRAKASNPRTAIGIVDENHYVFVVSDGRTTESAGLSLSELAAFMQELGVETAYNLDGGGSSTMVFMGQVINQPTTSGNRVSERSVSDIVYIGYTKET